MKKLLSISLLASTLAAGAAFADNGPNSGPGSNVNGVLSNDNSVIPALVAASSDRDISIQQFAVMYNESQEPTMAQFVLYKTMTTPDFDDLVQQAFKAQAAQDHHQDKSQINGKSAWIMDQNGNKTTVDLDSDNKHIKVVFASNNSSNNGPNSGPGSNGQNGRNTR